DSDELAFGHLEIYIVKRDFFVDTAFIENFHCIYYLKHYRLPPLYLLKAACLPASDMTLSRMVPMDNAAATMAADTSLRSVAGMPSSSAPAMMNLYVTAPSTTAMSLLSNEPVPNM